MTALTQERRIARLLTKNRRLRRKIAAAEDIIKTGLDIATSDMLEDWNAESKTNISYWLEAPDSHWGRK